MSAIESDDILHQILLRLPISSLVRLKSVSKRWLALISDPNFCHRRSTLHLPTPSGIFLRSCPHSRVFDFVDLRPNPPSIPSNFLAFSVPRHGIVILQSCNGLLLCRSEGPSHPQSVHYVYNPTTSKYRRLPKIHRNNTIAGISLAFDPLRSSNYKVVCVRVLDPIRKCHRIEIYSSDSDHQSWKPSSMHPFLPPRNTFFDCGRYWNGAVHWPCDWDSCLYFDLREEKLYELPMPGACSDWKGKRAEYFGNCGEHLHYIESSEVQTVLHVYVLKDDRGGWFEKYRVDLHTVAHLFPEKISAPDEGFDWSKFTVLAIVDPGEVDENPYVVLQGFHKLAVRLNVNTGDFETLEYILNHGKTTESPLGFGVVDAFLYIPSLACV